VGPTGIRDFEHFVGAPIPPLTLYRYLGNHFLSLVLIAASYFRNAEPQRIGIDAAGRPVDARDLFDAALLKRWITGVFDAYYRGFVGSAPAEPLPIELDAVVARMVEEMGVDRHMDEVLRRADQLSMSDEAFVRHVTRCGDSRRKVNKGETDIVVRTGPHLGAFNDTISLPELILLIESMAAVCMAGRYRRRRPGKTP
jgi:hypothetical protein